MRARDLELLQDHGEKQQEESRPAMEILEEDTYEQVGVLGRHLPRFVVFRAPGGLPR